MFMSAEKFKGATVTRRRRAGDQHAVVTLKGNVGSYRRSPCEECPWRRDLPTGIFPLEAFRISAPTAYDAAFTMFGCHMSKRRPLTCAGFLPSEGAIHNIGVRLACARERINLAEVDSDVPLYRNYREMAIANGVAPDDPALTSCRVLDKSLAHERPRATSE
jgi:hypothetical protein